MNISFLNGTLTIGDQTFQIGSIDEAVKIFTEQEVSDRCYPHDVEAVREKIRQHFQRSVAG